MDSRARVQEANGIQRPLQVGEQVLEMRAGCRLRGAAWRTVRLLQAIRMLEQLIQREQRGLRQVQRWVGRIGRDGGHGVTGVEHFVAEAPILTAEDDRYLLALLRCFSQRRDRVREREGVSFYAVVFPGEAEYELPISYRLRQRVEHGGGGDDVLGVVRDASD